MNRRLIVSTILGAIVLLFGFVWFVQGIGILPGSVMSGSQFWEIAGAVTFAIGILILVFSAKGLARKRKT
jgi:hypothetical protein